MDATDATVETLRNIHAEIAELRNDTNARLGSLQAGVAKLEATATEGFTELRAVVATTKETLGLIHHRLMFVEAAPGGATSARTRLDDRMDRLEARVDALEAGSDTPDP
jgi:BMFP domain-containing protein YqiC